MEGRFVPGSLMTAPMSRRSLVGAGAALLYGAVIGGSTLARPAFADQGEVDGRQAAMDDLFNNPNGWWVSWRNGEWLLYDDFVGKGVYELNLVEYIASFDWIGDIGRDDVDPLTDVYELALLSFLALLRLDATDEGMQEKADKTVGLLDYVADAVGAGAGAFGTFAGGTVSNGAKLLLGGLSFATSTLSFSLENVDRANDVDDLSAQRDYCSAILSSVIGHSDDEYLERAARNIIDALDQCVQFALDNTNRVLEEIASGEVQWILDMFPLMEKDLGDSLAVLGLGAASRVAGALGGIAVGSKIGQLAGDFAIGGRNMALRGVEVLAMSGLRRGLADKVDRLVRHTPEGADLEWVGSLFALSHALATADLRGEYCLWQMIVSSGFFGWAKEKRQSSWKWLCELFGKKAGETDKELADRQHGESKKALVKRIEGIASAMSDTSGQDDVLVVYIDPDEDEPSQDLTADDMYAAVSAYGKVCLFAHNDYDGDGRYEAFAVVGDDADDGCGYSLSGDLYYISPEGQISWVSSDFNHNYGGMWPIPVGESRKFLVLTTTHHGSGGSSHVFTAINGRGVEVPLPDNARDQFGWRGGDAFVATEHYFASGGGHQFIEHDLYFDEVGCRFVESAAAGSGYASDGTVDFGNYDEYVMVAPYANHAVYVTWDQSETRQGETTRYGYFITYGGGTVYVRQDAYGNTDMGVRHDAYAEPIIESWPSGQYSEVVWGTVFEASAFPEIDWLVQGSWVYHLGENWKEIAVAPGGHAVGEQVTFVCFVCSDTHEFVSPSETPEYLRTVYCVWETPDTFGFTTYSGTHVNGCFTEVWDPELQQYEYRLWTDDGRRVRPQTQGRSNWAIEEGNGPIWI